MTDSKRILRWCAALVLTLGWGLALAASLVDIPSVRPPPPGKTGEAAGGGASAPAPRRRSGVPEAAMPTRESLIGAMANRYLLTREDVQVMEPVCVLVLGYHSGGGAVWYVQLAKNPILDRPEFVIARGAISFHHYCWAEVARYRYFRSQDKTTRDAMADAMVNDLQFLITKRAWLPPKWPYMAKMLTALAEGYLMAEKTTEAVQSYTRAIESDRSYAPAYQSLADFWAKVGDVGQALETVKDGLKYQPDSKGLRKRYKEYGGKQPLPPIGSVKGLKTHETPEPEPAPKTPAPAPDKPTPALETAIVRVRPSEDMEVDIQRKVNPFCRFCPW